MGWWSTAHPCSSHRPCTRHHTTHPKQGYNNSSVAAKCGTMLRDALRNEKVARRFLSSGQVWPFFDSYVHMRNFEVASDAFATLKCVPRPTLPNRLACTTDDD